MPETSAEEVAAWFTLGRVPPRMPWWAAERLAEGHDGEALRELAGLNDGDARAIGDLLPAALAELGQDPAQGRLAAATTVFRSLAAGCLAGNVDERSVAQQVEQIVTECEFDDAVLALPLGRLYGLEDEWLGGWGSSVRELRETVRVRCAEQVAAA